MCAWSKMGSSPNSPRSGLRQAPASKRTDHRRNLSTPVADSAMILPNTSLIFRHGRDLMTRQGVAMRGARLMKILVVVLGGMTLFGNGCFSTTTTQGLAQTGVQTV